LNAHIDGISTLLESALKFLTIVQFGEIMEPVLLVTKDTKSKTELAFYLKLKAQATLDARDGIGTTKNVLNAHTDGTSTLTESALKLTIIVLLGEIMELVLLATLDMLLIMENVLLITFSVNNPLMVSVNLVTPDTFY